MRPKFRAWDSAKKEMFKDTFAITESGQVVVVEQEDVMSPPDYVFVNHLVIMQSTGLFDKNNKEIFEGDVVRQVRTQPTTENEIIIGVVTMLEGAWLIMNDGEQLASQLWSETDENEIIGNVCENEDILEDME
nr:YopX family protein [Streptococcus infantis]DAY41231.1 MAG TPA: YopX protein [Caudoviricetes sp.]